MTSNLYWEPTETGAYLGKDLKRPLCRHYETASLDRVFDAEDLPVLRGMLAAAEGNMAKELYKLVQLIEKGGSVRVWEKF